MLDEGPSLDESRCVCGADFVSGNFVRLGACGHALCKECAARKLESGEMVCGSCAASFEPLSMYVQPDDPLDTPLVVDTINDIDDDYDAVWRKALGGPEEGKRQVIQKIVAALRAK